VQAIDGAAGILEDGARASASRVDSRAGPEADDPQGLTYILTGAATALTVAALFGLLGGRLARGRTPRPA
jgi:hypothetical protein